MNAYIFDLDGTLLDSMDVWEQIDIDFLIKRGFEVPPDYINAVCARSFTEAAVYTIERFDLPDSVDDLLREWNGMAVYAYGHTVPLKPYAREYLAALREREFKLGIATSLPAAPYEPALHNHGIIELFDAICSTDEVAYGKTKPDVFLLAARKLGASTAECVVFEDIPQAIRSAKQAGMTVYGIYDESSKAHWALIQEITDGVFYDFRDAPLPE
ncbi:MAG TPA: HAD family hydrolase [Clostridiales bacterium]|jgi:HAD superfamily hydrolase (TIGR01509 family)|nr:HAD family hydrolase [Clostridiales bacterium]